MTRRGFVVASGLAVLGALTARSARGLEAAEAAAAPALRPAAARHQRRALRPLRLARPHDAGRRPAPRPRRRGARCRPRAPASRRAGREGRRMKTTRRQFLDRRRRRRRQRRRGRRPRPARRGRTATIRRISLPVDRVVRTTCSPNCTGSCGQLAFVRDGNVVKVQQAADYPENEYNPRGCMKGLSYHLLIHGPDRILKPLVRTGERGSGEFREATWDEVLDRIAGELKRIGEEWGWDAVHVFSQVPGSGYVQKGAAYRACAALGMTHGTSFDFNGDLPMGMPITFGVQNAEHESQGLGQQPLHPARRRQPAGDAHPRRALHPRRGGEGRAAGGGRPDVLVDGGQGGRLGADQARHRRGPRPRPLPPGDRGRQGRLGLHAHVHGRAAARAHRHRQAAARGRAGPRRGPGPGPGRGRRPRRVRRQGAARRAPRRRSSPRRSCRTGCRRCRTTATSPGTRPGASR